MCLTIHDIGCRFTDDAPAQKPLVPEKWRDKLKVIDELGGPKHFNYFPSASARAMDTPFQWTKQVASHFGGTRNPMIVSWPARIKDKGGAEPLRLRSRQAEVGALQRRRGLLLGHRPRRRESTEAPRAAGSLVGRSREVPRPAARLARRGAPQRRAHGPARSGWPARAARYVRRGSLATPVASEDLTWSDSWR